MSCYFVIFFLSLLSNNLLGCEHNGKFFNDGDRIPNAESPCYSCYCQGSSITCALADCKFRFDCEPEYVPGECCPRYDHCPPEPTKAPTTTMSTTYSPAPVFIPSTASTSTTTTSTTTTTTVIPPVEVVPTTITSREVVNEVDVTTKLNAHKQTTVLSKLVTDEPPLSEEMVIPITTMIPNRITMEDEVTTRKVELEPVSGQERKGESDKKDEVGGSGSGSDDGIIASGVIEVVMPTESALAIEDNYPTTKIWIADTSLSAEHKDSMSDGKVDEVVQTTTTTILNDISNNNVNDVKTSVTSENNDTLNSSTTSSTLSPSPSSTLEPIEEVSLTTTSDNL